MRRVHLFEFEDLAWFPAVLRDGITDFLEFAVVRSGLYDAVAPRLMRSVAESERTRIVDLCSGGGGAWLRLVSELPADVEQVVLSDLYPNLDAFAEIKEQTQGRVVFSEAPVDATNVGDQLSGYRTLFSSFHHLKPDTARAVLLSAVRGGEPIAVLESTQRHWLLLLYMLFTPLIVMVVTPFMRPFRWSRLLFTYLIPIIPLVIAFDGIVSCLRTYTESELLAMIDSLPDNNYRWDVGVQRIGALPVGVTYLIGRPSDAVDS